MTLKIVDGGVADELADLLNGTLERLKDEELTGLIIIAISSDAVDLSHTLMPRNELYWHLQKVAHHVLSEE